MRPAGGLHVFEVITAVEVTDEDFFEFRVDVKCFYSNDVRTVRASVRRDGVIFALREESRRPHK